MKFGGGLFPALARSVQRMSVVVDGSEQLIPLPGESKQATATVNLVDGAVIEIAVPAKGMVMRRWLEADKMMVAIDCKGLRTTREFTKALSS